MCDIFELFNKNNNSWPWQLFWFSFQKVVWPDYYVKWAGLKLIWVQLG